MYLYFYILYKILSKLVRKMQSFNIDEWKTTQNNIRKTLKSSCGSVCVYVCVIVLSSGKVYSQNLFTQSFI